MQREIEKLVELRKFSLGLIGISIIAVIYFFFIPLPNETDLLRDEGVIKKVTCICQNEKINGYKFLLNDEVYTLKWLDFHLDKDVTNFMSEGQLITFFYESKFFGVLGRKVYAVKYEDKKILEYAFLKQKYSENNGKVKAVIPYLLLIFIIGFFIINFMIRRRRFIQ